MKAKLLALAVAGLTGLAASADVLYWQVNNTAADDYSSANGRANYSYAILRATDSDPASTSGEHQYYVSQNLNTSGGNLGAAVSRDVFGNGGYVGGVMDVANILSTTGGGNASSLSALSFFIELYDSNCSWVGETSPVSYASLVESGTISGFNANFKGVNAAMGSSGYQVPEPTSGLLMLIGMGALALRRRRS